MLLLIMAGQPLERASGERIGAFYLIGLLRRLTDPTAESKKPINIAAIGDYLDRKTGRQIPGQVVLQLGFNHLNWQQERVDDYTLPILALGRQDTETPTLENATGTIEIAHRSVPKKRRINTITEDERIPLVVRIAGVDSDTNDSLPRVVALTYDADTHQLIKASFSLSQTEYQGLKNYISSANSVFSFQDIDIAISDPYRVSGLITAAMTARTKGVEELPHVKMLNIDVAQVGPQTPYEYRIVATTAELGYHDVVGLSIGKADGELLLGINPGDGIRFYQVGVPLELAIGE